MNRLEQMRRDCQRFHNEHPQVWELFVQFTMELIDRGREHGSADEVMHRVRWETGAGSDVEEFKINNNYVAFYARRFMKVHPEHEGFFRTRRQKSQGGSHVSFATDDSTASE